MRGLRILHLAGWLSLVAISLNLVMGCAPSATSRPQTSSTGEAQPAQGSPEQILPVQEPTAQDVRDDARAQAAIDDIVCQPAGKLTFVERTIMITSPNAAAHDALVYEDQNGARYFVDLSEYGFVHLEPSGLRFAPGVTLPIEAIRQNALDLASRSEGFIQRQMRLQLRMARRESTISSPGPSPSQD